MRAVTLPLSTLHIISLFRKVATVIIFDEIRADERDLVSEELRKRTAQCIQRSVIRQWLGFLAVKNFIYRIPLVAGVSRVVRK